MLYQISIWLNVPILIQKGHLIKIIFRKPMLAFSMDLLLQYPLCVCNQITDPSARFKEERERLLGGWSWWVGEGGWETKSRGQGRLQFSWEWRSRPAKSEHQAGEKRGGESIVVLKEWASAQQWQVERKPKLLWVWGFTLCKIILKS